MTGLMLIFREILGGEDRGGPGRGPKSNIYYGMSFSEILYFNFVGDHISAPLLATVSNSPEYYEDWDTGP